MNDHNSIIEKIIGWGLMAGFGGAVKYLSVVIKTPATLSNRRFLALLSANVFISAFCGLMGGMFVTTLSNDLLWQYLAAGLFGYLGTQGLDLLLLALRRKIEPASPVSAVIPIPPDSDPAAKA